MIDNAEWCSSDSLDQFNRGGRWVAGGLGFATKELGDFLNIDASGVWLLCRALITLVSEDEESGSGSCSSRC